MNKFIENIVNPPKEKNVGQIWKSVSTKYEILITDTTYIKDGIVQGVVVSRVVEAGDHNDVCLTDLDFYEKNRIAFRLTDTTLPVNDLKVYIGEITQDLIDKVEHSLTINSTKDYNELQLATINEIIEDLAELRHKALDLFENSLVEENEDNEKIVGRIDLRQNNEHIQFPTEDAIAASSTLEDINLKDNLLEHKVIEVENLFRIRFIKKTDEKLYLVFNVVDKFINKKAYCKIYNQGSTLLFDGNIELKEYVNYMQVAFNYENNYDYKMIITLDETEYEFILGL